MGRWALTTDVGGWCGGGWKMGLWIFLSWIGFLERIYFLKSVNSTFTVFYNKATRRCYYWQSKCRILLSWKSKLACNSKKLFFSFGFCQKRKGGSEASAVHKKRQMVPFAPFDWSREGGRNSDSTNQAKELFQLFPFGGSRHRPLVLISGKPDEGALTR